MKPPAEEPKRETPNAVTLIPAPGGFGYKLLEGPFHLPSPAEVANSVGVMPAPGGGVYVWKGRAG